MNWLEIKLRVDGEAAEAVAELLQRYGHQGVSIEYEGTFDDHWDESPPPPPKNLIVRAYVPADEHVEETKARLEAALGHMHILYPMPSPEYTPIDEDDWAEAWKAHYHPVRIGRSILIRPAWIEVEPRAGDIILSLDPGMAFGTGTHPTTQLCLEALEDLVKPKLTVLDLGCGSGILAIAAAKLGALSVLALDNDPLAVRITQENAAQNEVAATITAEVGSLENLVTSARRFDLVVVNILAHTIIQMCREGLGQIIRPGGQGVFSGIIEEQAPSVEEALQRVGLEVYRRRQQADWVAIEARRPHR
jgi:ribosomal protein L11 methyltransferase